MLRIALKVVKMAGGWPEVEKPLDVARYIGNTRYSKTRYRYEEVAVGVDVEIPKTWMGWKYQR